MSEQTNSMEGSMQPTPQQQQKNTVFSFSGWSEEEESPLLQEMKSKQQMTPLAESIHKLLANMMQTSFKEKNSTRTVKQNRPFHRMSSRLMKKTRWMRSSLMTTTTLQTGKTQSKT